MPPSDPSSSLRVHLISDHSLHISRRVYDLDDKELNERSNNSSEKNARATIFAAVMRVLSAKDIVILDGANYIKGWRYQLYCEAKAVRTTHCIVHVGTGIEKAREINEERLAKQQLEEGINGKADVIKCDEKEFPYEKLCWENLVFRYEEPNVFSRWDRPLFTILWEDEEPPAEAIWEALIGSDKTALKIVRPNAATVVRPVNGEDYLHALDQTTQAVLNSLFSWIKDHAGEVGGEVNVGENLFVILPTKPVGLPMLQRLKRQYINLNRTNTVPRSRILEGFVGYLNDSFDMS